MMKNPGKFRKFLILPAAVVLALVLVLLGYAVYLFADYSRIEDNIMLSVRDASPDVMEVGQSYTALSYNIGFAAYTPEFSFFMDGGTESRAFSKADVLETMDGICTLLAEQDADIIFLEEVDEKSTRSWHVNERARIEEAFPGYDASFAVNWDSSYLFYPFTQPHGKSLSGMATLSKFDLTSSIRRSLPVETSLMKFVDLDRCYTVSRIPVANGRELVLYTVHLSAYTSDGTIATRQLELLIEDMQTQVEAGNYVLCGGDFNKDLLGDSSAYFGVSGDAYTWAQPFPVQMLTSTGLSLAVPLGDGEVVPSCRNADLPYHDGQFVLTVDGFIVSDNIRVEESTVIDTGFAFSDHNPVRLKFVLEE